MFIARGAWAVAAQLNGRYVRRLGMTPQDIVPSLLRACPSAEARWQEHLAWWGDDERGLHNDVAIFAHHVVESFAEGRTDEFAAFWDVVESMVQSSDPQVKDLAIIGLIEDVQNIASHQPHGYSVFEPWLGSKTRDAWRTVEATWDGTGSLAEMIRRERDGV